MDWNTTSPPVNGGRAPNRREVMQDPEDVAAMLRLRQLGWGVKRIARELGISPNTVKRYLRQGGWKPYSRPTRKRALDGLGEWLEAELRKHRGNADVVRQELKRVHGVDVSLRTVERAVTPFRKEIEAEAKATVRFETPPGRQLQIDFGTVTVQIGDEKVKVKLFVATLGYSRRVYVAAFRHERQSAWMRGIEGAFLHFGGVTEQLLIDNPKPLVVKHDVQTREVEFNSRFSAFCRYWEVTPKACAPYRARTKGKDERGVAYAKRNAIAGRTFESWEHLEAHLAWWMREVADVRVHGTTGDRPIDRFDRGERDALRSLQGRTPFLQVREVVRRVATDALVDIDTNRYSVPWRLLREDVTVQVVDGRVLVLHAGELVAEHVESRGRHQVVRDPRHFAGLVGAAPMPTDVVEAPAVEKPVEDGLLRSLDVYEQAVGGGW